MSLLHTPKLERDWDKSCERKKLRISVGDAIIGAEIRSEIYWMNLQTV